LRILQGIGFSCAFGVAGAIVSDNTHESDDTYLLGILTVVGLLTQAIGPSFGEYLINTSGYRPLFQTATLFGLISLGLAFFLPSSESAGWRRIKKVHLISRSFFSTAILGIIFGSMVIFLPPYLMTQGVNNSSPFFIGFVFGGFLVWTVLYRVLKILNNHLVWIVMSLLLVLLLSFIRTAGSPAVLSVLALLCGIGYGYLYPTLNARMIEMNPSFKGIANSLFVWSFNIGMLLASVGFGFMCEYAGYETAFQATALVGFILMASTGFIGYKKLY
jgi:MFS family permease